MISLYLPGSSKIGSGYQAHEMAEAMSARGHRVTMFSPCPAPAGAAYAHRLVPTGNRFRTFRFAWNLRWAGLEDFDVIHAHGDDYWLLGRRWPVHVRTMHGSCFAEARHVPGLFEKTRMLLLGFSEVMASLVADRAICVSRNTTRYYPWLKRVIPNGVDLRSFGPGPKEDRPTILFVGTYNNRKRGRLLMDCFAREVRPALPDAQLWMVCSDAPAADGVSVFGAVSKPKLAELYRRAWVFCLPSVYEGFGVPYIEAMASGTPVVATPNPGAREVLKDGALGEVVEAGRLGPTLIQILQAGQRRDRLAQAGVRAARQYAWDAVVDQYEAVYQELLNARARAT